MFRALAVSRSAVGSPSHRRCAPSCILIIAWATALVVGAYWALLGSGWAHVTIWLNDVMALLSGSYRVWQGQVPSIDFASAYGAVIYYPTVLGLSLFRTPGEAMAFAQLVGGVSILLILIPVALGRIGLVPTLVLGTLLFLVVVTPVPMGRSPWEHTFGAFYNRHCWAWLAVTLLFYLEPRNPRSHDEVIGGGALAFALLMLLYTKVNFAIAAVGVAGISAMVSPRNLRLVIIAIAVVVLAVAAVSATSGYNNAYFKDISYLATINAAQLRPWDLATRFSQVVEVVLASAALLSASVMCLVILLLVGRRKLLDFAYFSVAVCGSIVVAMQTYAGIAEALALVSLIACLGELVRRAEGLRGAVDDAGGRPRLAGYVTCTTLLVVVATQPVIARAYGLFDYYLEASRDIANGDRQVRGTLNKAGIKVGPAFGEGIHEVLGHTREAHAMLAELRRATNADLRAPEYATLIDEGLILLGRKAQPDDRLLVFEMSDPFSPLLGLRSTAYGFPMFWAGAGFSRSIHPHPIEWFSDANLVLVPVVPYSQYQLDELLAVYGSFLRSNFSPLARSPHWELWKKSEQIGVEY